MKISSGLWVRPRFVSTAEYKVRGSNYDHSQKKIDATTMRFVNSKIVQHICKNDCPKILIIIIILIRSDKHFNYLNLFLTCVQYIHIEKFAIRIIKAIVAVDKLKYHKYNVCFRGYSLCLYELSW